MLFLLLYLVSPNAFNDYRAKLLHHKSLFVLLLAIIILSVLSFSLQKTLPNVLGVATNISVGDLLEITNEKRAEKGLVPLALDALLTDAAMAKAGNMFTVNYWAHTSPDGTTPWYFVQNVGYDYVYAGENLAKDFADSRGVVNAWLNSPSHRDNMLSDKYTDVGFAVVDGVLGGQETTLVVQMLGKKQEAEKSATDNLTPPLVAALEESLDVINTPMPPQPTPTLIIQEAAKFVAENELKDKAIVVQVAKKPLIDATFLTRNISIIILVILIFAFLADLAYIEREKIVRLVGHNADHIIFLTGALILMLIYGKGAIL